MKVTILKRVIGIVTILAVPLNAQVTYNFASITNDALKAAISENRFSAETDRGGLYTFSDTAPASLSADAEWLRQPSGVNPGELQGIALNIPSDQTFENTMNNFGDGKVRINVQGPSFGESDNDTFSNNGNRGVVPAPGAVLLASIGIICVGWFRRMAACS